MELRWLSSTLNRAAIYCLTPGKLKFILLWLSRSSNWKERRLQNDNNLNEWKSVLSVGDQDGTNWFYLFCKTPEIRHFFYSVQYVSFYYVILSRKNIMNKLGSGELEKTTLPLTLTFLNLKFTCCLLCIWRATKLGNQDYNYLTEMAFSL